MQKISNDLKSAIRIFLVFSVITGLVYPLLVTELAQNLMPERAKGSMLTVDGRVIGSELIGQEFTSPGYFHGRPSAVGYAANGSGASNLGPTSAKLMEQTGQRVKEIRQENSLSEDAPVPADSVLASGSGLDPHISLEAAMQQVPRIAKTRGMNQSEVQDLVRRNVESSQLSILGQERLNVLKLNLALDEITKDD
jgi:K+-transporting ATPase ATPase C chain